jgi:hypothetical protein
MPIPTPLLLFIYYALIFTLALIVRWAYLHRRDLPSPKHKDVEREFRIPYSPPPERRKRAFDWTRQR